MVDANPGFGSASIFNDSPTSGLGGWGNPNDDYQITTGAFAQNFQVVYPVPHRIRRNYTARSNNPDPFGDGTPPAPEALWNYFTPASQDALIHGYVGDFEKFQTQLEGPVVRYNSTDKCGDFSDAIDSCVLGFPCRDSPDPWWVSDRLYPLGSPRPIHKTGTAI